VTDNPHGGRFDVAVIGLGAMGSSATLAFARRGARVIGFDAASPPHSLGSTHGHTRIIREAYYEHPLYVPLVRRAYELWAELERGTGAPLFVATGGLMVGGDSSELFRGALASARTHSIEHEVLDADAVASRFPAYRPRPECVALYERRAGMLFPEHCVAAALAEAQRLGARLRKGERVTGWRANGRALRIATSRGECEAECVVVAAGPWVPQLAESLGTTLPVEIERQLSHWFSPLIGRPAARSASGRRLTAISLPRCRTRGMA
jgi:sarcosine oxidase